MASRIAAFASLALISTMSASFVQVAMPVAAVLPILSRQCADSDSSSCHQSCDADSKCYGYILSESDESPVCRHLTSPLCILPEPLHDDRGHSGTGSRSADRLIIKTSQYVNGNLIYPGYSPMFPPEFRTEFIERQVISSPHRRFIRSAIKPFVSNDWHNINAVDSVDMRAIQISSDVSCSTLCDGSQMQFGMSCGIAFESTITYSNKKIEVCRLFSESAATAMQTLKITRQIVDGPGYEISDVTMIMANAPIRNDVCRSPKWDYIHISEEDVRNSPPSSQQPVIPPSRKPTNKPNAGTANDDPNLENASAGNATDEPASESMLPSIGKSSFWSRFIFCAVIPASVIVVAVFASAIACNYSKQKLNRQVAQFWRWQQAGIPSDDFRPADDARDLIF